MGEAKAPEDSAVASPAHVGLIPTSDSSGGEAVSPVDPHGAKDAVRNEIAHLLPQSNGQLGLVAACLADGVTDRKEIVERGAAANVSAVGLILSNIRAIQGGIIPEAPSLAGQALSATRSFLKQHRSRLSNLAVKRLDDTIEALANVVQDRQAQEREEEELQSKGDELEETLAVQGGVYVYTYPHYWRYPTAEGTRRTYLKVGMTTKDAGERVRQQARGTNVPEEPLLLRVYQSQTVEPRDAERTFHSLLVAADHTVGESRSAAREWFETSVEFLDTIAQTLCMRVRRADDQGDG